MAARRAEKEPAPQPVATEPKAAADPAATGRIVRFRSQDGLLLAARVFDSPPSERLPLLCLPGLSRNSLDFLRLGAFFSTHPTEPRRVVALDYRGRGLSEHDRDWRRYTPLIEAQDMLAATSVLGIERAVIVGTSRGGIVAMLLGALRPALLAGVVLNDIGPVIEGTGLARIRKHLTAIGSFAGWDEAAGAARAAMGAHFPAAGDEDWQSYVRAFLSETPAGLAPLFDRNLLRADQSLERPPTLWPQFTSLGRIPALVVRGEHSDILAARTVAAMAERHPQLEQITVHGQGHAPFLRDVATLERIRSFAARCEIPAAA